MEELLAVNRLLLDQLTSPADGIKCGCPSTLILEHHKLKIPLQRDLNYPRSGVSRRTFARKRGCHREMKSAEVNE